MARKLKSDKLLFIATLLLVCAERRHGLQRLGGHGAGAVTSSRTCFLIEAGDLGACSGWPLLPLVMRIDYRHYRQPAFIWTALGAGRRWRWWRVLFGRPINGARRWFGVGGLGIQPSEFAKLVAIFFIAALLERRMHRINELALLAAADRRSSSAALVGLILLRAGLRHGDVAHR